MSDLRIIGPAAGVICFCAMAADGYAAGADVSAAPPNFTSIDMPWVATSQDYLPPQSGAGPVSYDKAHPVMERTPNQYGVLRQTPMRLANLDNPNLKPWVIDYLRKSNDELRATGLRLGARANCTPGGVPQFLLYAGGFENLYIIQTHKEILMIHEADAQIRHVYMNVSHSAHVAPSWYGESVGHYEGDELIVDTIGLNDRTVLDSHYDVPHTTQEHVVERFRLTDKMLEVSFTVEDPGAFNGPWSGIVRYRQVREPETLTEEPCAENNSEHLASYVHIPAATKADF